MVVLSLQVGRDDFAVGAVIKISVFDDVRVVGVGVGEDVGSPEKLKDTDLDRKISLKLKPIKENCAKNQRREEIPSYFLMVSAFPSGNKSSAPLL